MPEEKPEPELKEWVRVSRTVKATTVTVTVQRGPVTMKWTTTTAIFPSKAFREGVAEARRTALVALHDVEAALAEEMPA